MRVDDLEDRFERAQDQFWERHGFYDLTDSERKWLECLERLKNTVDIVPAALRDHAAELIAVDATKARQVVENMIEQIGPDYFPANAASFVMAMAQSLEAQASSPFGDYRGEKQE
ncbi:hypothetical protein [Bradyrhizobium sp. SYSU BS000235]|jgi:hypothetical protein|uniref:hypothetical protein n=1 Tax=Bradyrhizobium sp. SYSU BS000235 TaxID=3411332 RepID=UPI003C72A42B